MSTRSDEQHETNAPQREGGGSAKRKRSRPWGLLALAFALGLLMWSCIPKGYLISSSVDELSTGDAVIALRIGHAESVSGLEAPIHDSWVVLLDAQGNLEGALRRDDSVARLAWLDSGISYGSWEQEYLTTEDGTRVVDRDHSRIAEYGRYLLPDGRIVVVSSWSDKGLLIDTIEPDGSMTTVETEGTRGDMGQCGGRIVSIVDTKQLPRAKASEAFEAYAAQSGGDGDQPEVLSVVVQLTDLDGGTPQILGVAPENNVLGSGQKMFACEGDVITVPGIQVADPDSTKRAKVSEPEGTLVLQRWDLSTGQRTVIPVLDEQGNPIELGRDPNIDRYVGIQVGREYRFISADGHAFAVDLDSGQGRHLFSYREPGNYPPVLFQVTKTGVYALEDRWDDHHVTLSFTPWESGERRVVWTTSKLAGYLESPSFLDSHVREIEAFTLRPGWDGGAQ